MIGIYKITSPSNKIYIGQSIDIERRKNEYKNCSKKQQRVHNSINKYCFESHLFEIIEHCNIELLNERERYWQDFYNVLNKNGLNCRLTKTNDKSGFMSEETIEKLKNKSFDYLIGNKFRTGIKHSDYIKNKIKNTLIENSKKDNYVNAMSGRVGVLNPFFGKKHSAEVMLKINITKKLNKTKWKYNEGYLLLDNSTGIYYMSIGEASYCLYIKKSTLKAMLSGKFKNKSNLIKV